MTGLNGYEGVTTAGDDAGQLEEIVVAAGVPERCRGCAAILLRVGAVSGWNERLATGRLDADSAALLRAQRMAAELDVELLPYDCPGPTSVSGTCGSPHLRAPAVTSSR